MAAITQARFGCPPPPRACPNRITPMIANVLLCSRSWGPCLRAYPVTILPPHPVATPTTHPPRLPPLAPCTDVAPQTAIARANNTQGNSLMCNHVLLAARKPGTFIEIGPKLKAQVYLPLYIYIYMYRQQDAVRPYAAATTH